MLWDLRAWKRCRYRPGTAPGRAGRTQRPAVHPGSQRAGHGAHRSRVRPDEEPLTDLRSLDQRRTWRHQHVDRRSIGHHQSATGAAAAGGYLRRPQRFAAAAGAGAARLRRRHGERRFPAGLEVLRPGLAPRTAACRVAFRNACVDRPGRDRCGDAVLPTGRSGGGVRLAHWPVREEGLACSPAAARAICPGGGCCDHQVGKAATRRGRRRCHVFPRAGFVGGFLRGDRHSRRAEPGRQGDLGLRPSAVPGGHRLHGHHSCQRDRQRGGCGDRYRHPLFRLHDG